MKYKKRAPCTSYLLDHGGYVPIYGSYNQGRRSCCILPSRMGEHGVSLENMGNMENMENMEKNENINQMTQKSPEDF